jgi:hypothetical protein
MGEISTVVAMGENADDSIPGRFRHITASSTQSGHLTAMLHDLRRGCRDMAIDRAYCLA